jgi:hypothetical protein
VIHAIRIGYNDPVQTQGGEVDFDSESLKTSVILSEAAVRDTNRCAVEESLRLSHTVGMLRLTEAPASATLSRTSCKTPATHRIKPSPNLVFD